MRYPTGITCSFQSLPLAFWGKVDVYGSDLPVTTVRPTEIMSSNRTSTVSISVFTHPRCTLVAATVVFRCSFPRRLPETRLRETRTFLGR
jgi:hypothetical protein